MIEVKNLVKRYGNHTAVDHLSFTVDKGQVLGFLGPNGAGKSTTMNIITGYISATEGSVTVNGLDVFEEPEEVKKMIGYLPEFPPLYPDMTVIEYLYFVADIKKVKKSEKKQMTAEIMEATKITPMANRLIKHLSKGYKQRVGLAQAIMGYPELIILDEPTVGLDPKQIIEIRDLIRELSKNHTIILSSHIMQEVSAVCDTILIINKGKLILIDKPENLSRHFGATGGLKLAARGDRDNILGALNKIERVTKVEELEQFEEGTVNLKVYCDESEDIREEVFYAMYEAKAPLLELQSLRMSLEDIFLEVTNKADTPKDDTKIVDMAKGDTDKAETEKADTAKTDTDKTDTDKTDRDKIDTNHSDTNNIGTKNSSIDNSSSESSNNTMEDENKGEEEATDAGNL